MSIHRNFAVINFSFEDDNLTKSNILKLLDSISETTTMHLFYFSNAIHTDRICSLYDRFKNVRLVNIPSQYKNNRAAIKNFVIKYMFEKVDNHVDFFHIIDSKTKFSSKVISSDNTTINPKQYQQFIDDIEKLMQFLDLQVWFSTVASSKNYVFDTYNALGKIVIDDSKYSYIYNRPILISGTATDSYTIYNKNLLVKKSGNETFEYNMFFNELFSIPDICISDFMIKYRKLISARSGNNIFEKVKVFITTESEVDTFEKMNDIDFLLGFADNTNFNNKIEANKLDKQQKLAKLNKQEFDLFKKIHNNSNTENRTDISDVMNFIHAQFKNKKI